MPIYRYVMFLNKRLDDCEKWLKGGSITDDLYDKFMMQAIKEPELVIINDFVEAYIYWNSCKSSEQYIFYHQMAGLS